jgi:polyferredoxin
MKKIAILALGAAALFAFDPHPDAKLYKQLCGECHMAYQPQMLPKRSWKKMMKTLADHFGTDASLEPAEKERITRYLMLHAGDNMHFFGKASKFALSVPPSKSPLRISETPYFIKEHREIPKWAVEQKEVKSFANCVACHPGAERGNYSERQIRIPNLGRWED